MDEVAFGEGLIRRGTFHLIGDLDGDGTVGIVDFLMLLAHWGPCTECATCTADLDCDCDVGITDFLILLMNWT